MSKLANKNIFITGATGLVGSHLVERLLELGPQKIVCLVRGKDPEAYFYSSGLADKVVLAYGDLRSKERIFELMVKHEIDIVFHEAAQAIVHAAYLDPYSAFNSNINGTINILEAARLSPYLEAMVVASSDKAYGKNCQQATEDQAMAGDHPYDVSKSCADLIARSYFTTYQVPVAVSRFGNIYGPGDFNFNRIIPGIMKAIINNGILEIRSDGTFRRDYLYVIDVVDGYICLAENIAKAQGQAFNFSSVWNFSVLELVARISDVMNKQVDYKILNNEKNEIPSQSLNFDKARQVLGWQPASDFNNSIKQTYSWYEKYFKSK